MIESETNWKFDFEFDENGTLVLNNEDKNFRHFENTEDNEFEVLEDDEEGYCFEENENEDDFEKVKLLI